RALWTEAVAIEAGEPLEAARGMVRVAEPRILGDGDRLIARRMQLLGESGDSIREAIAPGPYTVLVREEASEERHMRGECPTGVAVGPGIGQAGAGQRVDRRRRARDLPVRGHVVGPDGVEDGENDRRADVARAAARDQDERACGQGAKSAEKDGIAAD